MPSCFKKLRMKKITQEEYDSDKNQLDKEILDEKKKYKVYVRGEYIGFFFSKKKRKIVLISSAYWYRGYLWRSFLDSKFHNMIRKLKLLKLEKYDFIKKEINKRWPTSNTLENNYAHYSDLKLDDSGFIYFIDHCLLYSPNYGDFIKTRKQAKKLLKCIYWLDKHLTKWCDIWLL